MYKRQEYEKFLGQEQQLLAQDERISRLESQIELLTEALRLARHKQFGASSEKADESVMEQMSFLFNEAEVFSAAETEEPEETDAVSYTHLLWIVLFSFSYPLSGFIGIFSFGKAPVNLRTFPLSRPRAGEGFAFAISSIISESRQ